VITFIPSNEKHSLPTLFSLFFNFLAGHVFASEIFDAARQQNPAKVKELIAQTPAQFHVKIENEIEAQYYNLG